MLYGNLNIRKIVADLCLSMKRIIIYLLIFAFLGIAIVIVMLPKKYPTNEWQSRHDCRVNLRYIASALRCYLEVNNNKMPCDIYQLTERNLLPRSRLVCPSQHIILCRDGYLEEDSPLFVFSYRIMVPGQDYEKIEDGTVIVKEFENNHLYNAVGGEIYQTGYYVLVKKDGRMETEFMAQVRKE